MVWQLQDYDMCIARNEEALRIQPQFAECYGNMANAWKVNSLSFAWSVCYWQYLYNCDLLSLRKKGTLIVQSATTWSPLRFVPTLMLLLYLHFLSLFLTLSFGSISQLKPNYADAWSNLASAYMRKGRLSEATQCCQQALSLNPLLVIFWIYDPFILIKKTSSSHLIMWFCFPLGWCT